MSEDTREKTSGLRNLVRRVSWLVGATAGAMIMAEKDPSFGKAIVLVFGEMLVGVLCSLNTHNLNYWRARHPAREGESDLQFVVAVLKGLRRENKPESVSAELSSAAGD